MRNKIIGAFAIGTLSLGTGAMIAPVLAQAAPISQAASPGVFMHSGPASATPGGGVEQIATPDGGVEQI